MNAGIETGIFLATSSSKQPSTPTSSTACTTTFSFTDKDELSVICVACIIN